jgi:predicted ribosomally synthesized peptide with SipW-like signal peptide
MKKFFTKIIALWIILCLNYTGILGIGEAFAYFSDSETIAQTIFQAGVLDFLLTADDNFASNTPGDPNKRAKEVTITKTGSLDFQYRIRTDNESNCTDYQLKAISAEGIELGPKNLSSFDYSGSQSQTTWEFVLTKPESASGTCSFDIIFEAWQINLNKGQGFSHEEVIKNSIDPILKQTNTNIVLNEFLPNPDDFPYEYIELYNLDSQSQDLAGYYIQTTKGTQIPINTTTTAQYAGCSTTINGTNWMAITTLTNDDLDNTADTLTLYTNTGEILDTISYPLNGEATSSMPQDKSIARIPDGTGSWVDPYPTPGGPNREEKNQETKINNQKVEDEEDKNQELQNVDNEENEKKENQQFILENKDLDQNSNSTTTDTTTATSTSNITQNVMEEDNETASTTSDEIIATEGDTNEEDTEDNTEEGNTNEDTDDTKETSMGDNTEEEINTEGSKEEQNTEENTEKENMDKNTDNTDKNISEKEETFDSSDNSDDNKTSTPPNDSQIVSPSSEEDDCSSNTGDANNNSSNETEEQDIQEIDSEKPENQEEDTNEEIIETEPEPVVLQEEPASLPKENVIKAKKEEEKD